MGDNQSAEWGILRFTSPIIGFLRRHYRWMAIVGLLFWLIAIAVLSLLPFRSIAFLSPSLSDYITHFIAYAVGGVLAGLWFRHFIVSWVVVTAIGTLIEFGQTWMGTGRSSELAEGVANGMGALIGVAIAVGLRLAGHWLEKRR